MKVEIPTQEEMVDEDLVLFDTWFQEATGDKPLTPFERAIIKTYLWWKTHPGETPNAPSNG